MLVAILKGVNFNDFFIFIFRFFSPVGMVPVIALTGFGLFNRGFPMVCLSL